jgi:hypothetical protein
VLVAAPGCKVSALLSRAYEGVKKCQEKGNYLCHEQRIGQLDSRQIWRLEASV